MDVSSSWHVGRVTKSLERWYNEGSTKFVTTPHPLLPINLTDETLTVKRAVKILTYVPAYVNVTVTRLMTRARIDTLIAENSFNVKQHTTVTKR